MNQVDPFTLLTWFDGYFTAALSTPGETIPKNQFKSLHEYVKFQLEKIAEADAGEEIFNPDQNTVL